MNERSVLRIFPAVEHSQNVGVVDVVRDGVGDGVVPNLQAGVVDGLPVSFFPLLLHLVEYVLSQSHLSLPAPLLQHRLHFLLLPPVIHHLVVLLHLLLLPHELLHLLHPQLLLQHRVRGLHLSPLLLHVTVLLLEKGTSVLKLLLHHRVVLAGFFLLVVVECFDPRHGVTVLLGRRSKEGAGVVVLVKRCPVFVGVVVNLVVSLLLHLPLLVLLNRPLQLIQIGPLESIPVALVRIGTYLYLVDRGLQFLPQLVPYYLAVVLGIRVVYSFCFRVVEHRRNIYNVKGKLPFQYSIIPKQIHQHNQQMKIKSIKSASKLDIAPPLSPSTGATTLPVLC